MYIILELQTHQDGTVSSMINNYSDYNEAESRYYTALAAAAISSIPRHAVVMMQDNGLCIQNKYYDH